MPLTIEQFSQRLSSSGVMSAEELRAWLSSFSTDGQPTDGEQLARELVRQKRLTKYQAEQIYMGKGSGLTFGNYVILDKLGQGGMGMVLKAEHQRMKRIVALKVLSPDAVKTPDAVRRFEREVQAAAKLEHQNIVAAYDADRANNTTFLVMQFVDGDDLSAIVKKSGPLAVDRAIDCVLQAARGLEFAHRCGVIHRDIKPANLLLGKDGVLKILDMGLARIEDPMGNSHEASLTGTGTVMGTIDFMSPEQALDTKTADARTDIYALGCTLFYLLTGAAPYPADTLMKRLLAHRESPIPPLPGVPVAVEKIFRRMVAKKTAERYASMTEVIADLQRCLTAVPASPIPAPSQTIDTNLADFFAMLSQPGNSATSVAPSGPSTATKRTRVLPKSPAEAATLQWNEGASDTDPSAQLILGGQRSSPKSGGQGEASKPNRMLLFGGIGGVVVLLLGLGWFLTPPRKDNVASLETSERKAKTTSKSPTGQTGKLKDSAEKKALDWLFSVGAQVAVGQQGGVVGVNNTAEALASGKPVVYVELAQRPISDKDLAQFSVFPSIYFLELSGTKVTDRGLPALVNCRSLTHLSLVGTSVTSEGLVTISQISGMKYLILNNLPISSQSLVPLQKLSLEYLYLESCENLTDECGAVLAQFPTLEYLNVGNSSIGDRAIQDLSKSPKLRFLSLNKCQKLTDEYGVALAQMPGLEHLDASETLLSDRTLQDLSKLRSLKKLEIRSTQANETAIPILSQMKSLTTLDIQRTKFTADGVKQLVAAMPWCEIHSDHGVFKATAAASDTTVSSLMFDGVDDRVEIPEWNTEISSLTVECLIRCTGGSNPSPVAFGGNGFTAGDGWAFTVASGYALIGKANVYDPANWHHLAGVSDNGQLRFYINGRLVDSAPGRCTLVGENFIGCRPLNGQQRGPMEKFFGGQITEGRVSKVARYKTDFAAIAPQTRFVPDADTLALYHFDEGSGDVLKDSSGNNHHGKIVGAKWVTAEPLRPTTDFELAFTFASGKSDQRVTIPLDNLDPNRPWTVEGYMQPTNQPDHNHALLVIFEGDSWHLNLNHWSMRLVEHAPKGQPMTEHVIAEQDIPRGKRIHVAGVFAGKTARLFIDGKLIGSAASTLLPKVQNQNLILGARYDGTMDEWRVSKVARYEKDFTPPTRYETDADTLALYHFDEGSGDVLKDSSGHNHHGQIVGAKWVGAASVPESALSMNGNGDFVEVQGLEELAAPLTLEAWVEPKQLQKGHLIFLGAPLWTTLELHAEHWMMSVIRPDRSVSIMRSGEPPRINRLVHVAGCWDGMQVSLFVDGRRCNTPGTATGFNWPGIRKTFIGRNTTDGSPGVVGNFVSLRLSNSIRYSADFVPQKSWVPDAQTVVLYHCNEGGGDTLKDSSGHNHHGKIVGAKWVMAEPPPSPPDFELAFESGKTQQRVTIPLDDLDPNRPWTVEGYLQPVDQPDHNHALPAVFEGDSWHLNLNHWSMRLVEHAPKGQPATEHVIAEQDIPRGKRIHVAGVFDGKTARLFIDGKLVGSAASTLLPKVQKQNLILGARYDGTMDEWRVSKVARYEQDFTPPKRYESDADTLALYHFNEGNGAVLKDSSGNNHHGQIDGAKWVQAGDSLVAPRVATKTIDLLPLVDLQRDAGIGNWKKVADGIACEASTAENVLQLPYEPPDEYDFEIEFTTTGNGLNVNQYVAAGGQMFAWKLNSHNVTPPLYGFELIDGKFAKDFKDFKGVATQIPDAINDGQRYRSTVEVRRGSLRTLLDGKELVKWTGDFKRLSMEPSTPMKHPGRIGIGSWRRPVTFHAVTVREVSGPGKLLAAATDWLDLFNGSDLTGWKVMGVKGWTREGGVLVGRTSQADGNGWLMSEREFSDFELALDYKLSPGSNSGIFLRAWPEGDVSGKDFREIQLLDDEAPAFATLQPNVRTGSLFGKVAPNPAPKLPANEWHRVRVLLVGPQLQLTINDVIVLKHTLTDLRPSGRIGLQLYPSQVEFRNVRIRVLGPADVDGKP